jgi:hypothetical protein
MAPQNKRVKNSKKNKPLNTIQTSIPEHSKISFYVAMLLLEFKDDFKNFRWLSYSILNCLKINKKYIRVENKRGQTEET